MRPLPHISIRMLRCNGFYTKIGEKRGSDAERTLSGASVSESDTYYAQRALGGRSPLVAYFYCEQIGKMWYTLRMGDFGTMVLAAVGVAIIVLALRFFLSLRKTAPSAPDVSALRTQKDERGNTIFVRCPVCDTPLAKTDNLASKIFRPMDTPDQRMIVMGCPHCYPVCESGLSRSCPVCHRTIPSDGYLVARLFNHRNNKKHVIVTGCSEEGKK